MKIVSLSLCYPSPDAPNAGFFVRERLSAMNMLADVRVISPQPVRWFSRRPREVVAHPGPPETWHIPMPYVRGLSLPFNAKLYARAVALTIERLVAQGGVDILDAHFCWPDGGAVALLAKRFNLPYAITLRGLLGKYSHNPLTKRQVVASLRGATAVVAVSSQLAEEAREAGVHPDRIHVIPNGVDTNIFTPMDRDAARSAVGCDGRDTVLVTVGHLCERKGVHRVLDILPSMIDRHPRLRYVVIGADAAEGRFEHRLRRLASKLGLADRVDFLGHLQAHDVAKWLNAADLFVLPTSNEGCCNAICEALAVGLPVVATDVGGNRELVTQGSGQLVPFGDGELLEAAVSCCLNEPFDRERIARDGCRRSWKETAARAIQVLTEAAEEFTPNRNVEQTGPAAVFADNATPAQPTTNW